RQALWGPGHRAGPRHSPRGIRRPRPAYRRQHLRPAGLRRSGRGRPAPGPGARGTAALSGGGRWAVLDLKVPDSTPGWLTQLGTATVRPFASVDEWIMRRRWEAIRVAMQEGLADFAWTELFFGTAF